MDHQPERQDQGQAAGLAAKGGFLNTPDRLVQDIMQGIYEGRYAPGQRLIEVDLAKRYGVSRSSIREALSRLIAEGVVTFERHRGAYIRKASRKELLDNLMVIETLTGLLARLAAARIGAPGAKDRLREAAEAVLKFHPHSYATDYGLTRRRFFDVLIEIGDNRELARMLEGAQLSMIGAQLREYAAPLAEARIEDFTAIYEHVVAGDADAAEGAARRHVRRVSDVIEAMPVWFDDPIHGPVIAMRAAPKLRN